jgi:hypothetical protein
MARQQFFSGNYGSSLGSTAQAANLVAQAGAQQGQMFANLGASIGSSIQKFRDNKAKKEKKEAAKNQFLRMYENNPTSPIFESFGIQSLEEAKAVAGDIAEDPALVTQAMQFAQNTMVMDANRRAEELRQGGQQFTSAMLGTAPKQVKPSDSKIRDFFNQERANEQASGLATETNPEAFRERIAKLSQSGQLNQEGQNLALNQLMRLQQAKAASDAPKPMNELDVYEGKKIIDKAYEQKPEKDMSGPTIVNDSVDRALGLISPFTTGFGAYLKNIPASDAKSLDTTLETIKANIGFDKLQAMREASPTGGALGQVSERELTSLQAVFGNLDQSQKDEDLKYNLMMLQAIYNDVVHGKGNHPFQMPRRDGQPEVTKEDVDLARQQLEERKQALGR